MSGRIPRFLFSALVSSELAAALVPADPTITAAAVLPRQNDDRFIGYLEYSGSWYSETCNVGLTWYQDGKYGQCCPQSLASCYAPTACVSGSLIYPYPDKSTTRTIACTENFQNTAFSICNTAFIFENSGDSSPKTDIICGNSAVNWSYYRKIPASATEIKSSPAPLSIPQVASTAGVVTGQNQDSNSGSKKSGGSKAWIAGAVVGPLLGLALIGAVVFFLLRRRKNKKHVAPQQGGAAMSSVDPSQPPAGVGGFTDAKPQFAQQPPHQGGFNPDPYANQGAYNANQGYHETPLSPVPQYQPNGPGSPPPQQAYQSDVKYGYAAPPHGNAAEVSGETSGIAPVAPAAHTSPVPQAAELGGETRPGAGPGLFGSSELAATSTNPRH